VRAQQRFGSQLNELLVALLGRGVPLPAPAACASGSRETEERSCFCAHHGMRVVVRAQQRFGFQLNELLVALLGRGVTLPAPAACASGSRETEERSCFCAHHGVRVVVRAQQRSESQLNELLVALLGRGVSLFAAVAYASGSLV